jgi:hypothetical protein
LPLSPESVSSLIVSIPVGTPSQCPTNGQAHNTATRARVDDRGLEISFGTAPQHGVSRKAAEADRDQSHGDPRAVPVERPGCLLPMTRHHVTPMIYGGPVCGFRRHRQAVYPIAAVATKNPDRTARAIIRPQPGSGFSGMGRAARAAS